MEECFKCFISGDKALLYDAISNEGIVKICENCSYKESLPILRKPTGFPVTDVAPQKRETVYERMSRLSGVSEKAPENKELVKQESSLKSLVDENYMAKIPDTKPRTDLIDNFHWIIMRARRRTKLTQEQFAESISESGEAIKQAEKGIIHDDKLITKIENKLGIQIRKEPLFSSTTTITPFEAEKEMIITQVDEGQDLSFNEQTTKMLTISDLQEIKQKKEADIFENPEKSEDAPEFIEKPENDLSDEEVDDILFGRNNKS